MGLENDNPGKIEADAYRVDPPNVDVPDSAHHEFRKGVDASGLQLQRTFQDQLVDLESVSLDPDQNDAIDAANNPSASNPLATLLDIADQAAASQTSYVFTTNTSSVADTEVGLNNADPTLATVARFANLNKNSLNLSNILLLLGDSDAVVISDNNEADKSYNYDVTGDPTQVGGSGSGGYVEVPVSFFSQGTGGNIVDTEVVDVLLRYDGSNTKFLSKANNLSDLANASSARTNLDVYSKSETYTKGEVDGFIGGSLQASNNLSDLANTSTARTNLDVYSKSEADSNFLNASSNLFDLANTSTARTNLDVYSKSEADNLLDDKLSKIADDTTVGNITIDKTSPRLILVDDGGTNNGQILFNTSAGGEQVRFQRADNNAFVKIVAQDANIALDMDAKRIQGLKDPSVNQDAATKIYVDDSIASAGGGISAAGSTLASGINTGMSIVANAVTTVLTLAFASTGTTSGYFLTGKFNFTNGPAALFQEISIYIDSSSNWSVFYPSASGSSGVAEGPLANNTSATSTVIFDTGHKLRINVTGSSVEIKIDKTIAGTTTGLVVFHGTRTFTT